MSNYVNDMTNEEIWKMLKPKMEKNGLEIAGYLQDYICAVACYDEDDVHNAIALAYRSGYERAMKGRPFKISGNKIGHSEPKKEKTGHWVPVDPNNLPKEGTKVKYTRKCKDYADDIIMIGDTGIVEFEGIFNPMWFGMKLDKARKEFFEWVDFSADGNATCLDMWVEDDE